MMQHKFLLFSALCYCLLQIILCDGPNLPKLPRSAMLRPRLPSQSSFSSATASSTPTEGDLKEKLNQPVISPSQSESETSAEDPSVQENPEKVKKSPSLKRNLSRSASKKEASPDDPLNIADLNELKERAKQVIRNLLKDNNANRAILLMATNIRDLMENEVASKIILNHTHLIKDTLTNKDAKELINDFRLDISKTFMDKETPQKTEKALKETKAFLSDENLPNRLQKRFKILKNILKNNKTYSAMVTLKNAVVKFIKAPKVKLRIAQGFKLLDFGIHFDPNNVMSSLGLPVSFFK